MNKIGKQGRLLFRRTAVCICFVLAIVILGAGIGECLKILKPDMAAAQAASSPPPSRAASAGVSRPTSSAPKKASEPAKPLKPESWFNDAVLIGDSRTEGLQNYDGLGDASYFAIKGLMVDTVYTKSGVKLNGKKLTVMDALKQKKFGKVYIMLGLNELGWSSFKTFLEDYGKMVDDVKKDQPGAKIYLQSILPVTAKKSATDKVYTNQKIKNSNQAIQKLAVQKKVIYLAVNTAVADSTGALPANAAVDGIHLNAEYCKKWCEYLRSN